MGYFSWRVYRYVHIELFGQAFFSPLNDETFDRLWESNIKCMANVLEIEFILELILG